MLQNATLRRVDPPPPGSAGQPLRRRCALATPTAGELQWLTVAGLAATAVMYLPAGSGNPAVAIVPGGLVVAELDGQDAKAWRVVHVADRVGDVLRYCRVFLSDDPG